MDTVLRLSPPARSGARWAFRAAVFGGHALLLWALLQSAVVERVVRAAAPLSVRIVEAPAAPTPAPSLPTPAHVAPPAALPLPAPVVDVLPSREATPAAAAVAATPAPSPIAEPMTAPPNPPPAPAPAPAPQRLAASSLRYLIEPPVEVPRLSRRARESGTVLLHVVVDVRGLPKDVQLRRSSGFARLDEQALAAMRQARFVPCTAEGRPVECESDAPIVYELEK